MSSRRPAGLALTVALVLALAAPAAAQRDIAPLPGQWREGVSVSAYWWQDLTGPRFATWLGRARSSARAREITLVVPWFQYFSDRNRSDHLNAVEIHRSPGSTRRCRGSDGRAFRFCKTPSDAAVRSAVRRAKRLGLRVVLRPQLEVGRSVESTRERDLVDKGPGERRAWFDAYKRFLSTYARIARDTGADGLVVGAGLSGMTDDDADRAEWRAIVAEVRDGRLLGDPGRGFRGELTYAAKWDSIVQDALDPTAGLFFWDVLDVIGIDAEFPLVPDQANPDLETLRRGWTTTLGGLAASPVDLVRALQAEYGRPVVFTGLGYLSRFGTAAFPEKSEADQARAGGGLSEAAQARPVRAAFDVWAPIAAAEPWFRGITWSEWPAAGRGGPRDGSRSVQGKAAEVEICLRHAGVFTPRCRRSRGAGR